MMTANARISPRKVNSYFTFKCHNCLDLLSVPDDNTNIHPDLLCSGLQRNVQRFVCASFYFLNIWFSSILFATAVMVCLSSPLIVYFEEYRRLFQTLVGDSKNNPGNNTSPYLNILHRWWKMAMNSLPNDN